MQSLWEDANYFEQLELHGRGNLPNWRRTSFTSRKTAGDTSQLTLRNFSFASAVSSSASGISPPVAGGDPMQRIEQNKFRRAGEVPSVLPAKRGPAQNNINNSQTTQRLQPSGEPHSVVTVGGHHTK